jgi:hypothetical protein
LEVGGLNFWWVRSLKVCVPGQVLARGKESARSHVMIEVDRKKGELIRQSTEIIFRRSLVSATKAPDPNKSDSLSGIEGETAHLPMIWDWAICGKAVQSQDERDPRVLWSKEGCLHHEALK